MTSKPPSDEEIQRLRRRVEAVEPDENGDTSGEPEPDDEDRNGTRSDAWHRRVLRRYRWDAGRKVPGIDVARDHAPPPSPEPTVPTDQRIRAEVCERLTLVGLDLGPIAVEVTGGVVTLRGTLPQAEARRRAIALARSTPGVRQVVNALRAR